MVKIELDDSFLLGLGRIVKHFLANQKCFEKGRTTKNVSTMLPIPTQKPSTKNTTNAAVHKSSKLREAKAESLVYSTNQAGTTYSPSFIKTHKYFKLLSDKTLLISCAPIPFEVDVHVI